MSEFEALALIHLKHFVLDSSFPARIGDFLEDVYVDHSYLHGMQLLPSTTVEFLRKVLECHRNLV